MINNNRETWLYKAVELLKPLFEENGATIPANIRIGVGFPSVRALSASNRRIGECWANECSTDQANEIIISLLLADAVEVLGVVIHEIVHAVVGTKEGHKGAFAKLAKCLGLTGKMTATTIGAELRPRLEGIIAEIGPYPHAALNPQAGDRKKQSTRMLKAVCDECGYTVRLTQKWVDVGLPTCPCGGGMGLN